MKKILISIILTLFLITSCQSWLDVNKNVDAPDVVDPILRLAPVLASYEGIGYELRALNPIVYYFGGTGYSSTFGLSHGYYAASDAGGEFWRMTYWLQGMNLEHIIDDGIEREEWGLAGIGLAVKAYSWHLLSSYHGDAPLKEAFVPTVLSHHYDDQEYIFSQVRKWAKEAIELLDREQGSYSGIGTYDLVYAGDWAKWKKFAHGVLARNYIAMSGKHDRYLDSAIFHVDNSFASADDDASFRFDATGLSTNSNFFGRMRGNISNTYAPSDYMVQIMTGTVPKYGLDGNYEDPVAPVQIITDTNTFDPRAILMFSTRTAMPDNQADIKLGTYSFVGTRHGYSPSCNFFGLTSVPTEASSGTGRWLFKDDAPWPLMIYAEMQFIKAEAQFRKGDKTGAFETFKKAVRGHFAWAKSLITPAVVVKNSSGVQTSVQGDKITLARFNELEAEYLKSKFVDSLPSADFSLSHIMMQKYVAGFPWSTDTWNDIRRYHYDLKLDPATKLPAKGISYTDNIVFHKDEADADRIYKGFYLYPADVQNRRSKFGLINEGAPMYRVRPRYNSEYMWNKDNLEEIKPISGMADNYHTSMIWFAIPE